MGNDKEAVRNLIDYYSKIETPTEDQKLVLKSLRILMPVLHKFDISDLQILEQVLQPACFRITSIGEPNDEKSNRRAEFGVMVNPQDAFLLVKGKTGKIVPKKFVEGSATWKEIIKGRVLTPPSSDGKKPGKYHLHYDQGGKKEFSRRFKEVRVGDYFEIDRFGAIGAIQSALVECALGRLAKLHGFSVKRMPEDTAKEIGSYSYYDFELSKNKVTRRVEVKSLWGSNTRKARLIHSKDRDNKDGKFPTSSCRFDTQEIFAVALWLATGSIDDFAFALSVSNIVDSKHGLPHSSKYVEHVTQNPTIYDDEFRIVRPWTSDLNEIWEYSFILDGFPSRVSKPEGS